MLVPSGDDMRCALAVLDEIGRASASLRTFAEAAVNALPRVVQSDVTTLSYHDLRSDRRRVVSRLPRAVQRDERDAVSVRICGVIDVSGAVAIPLYADDRHLVSLVLERKGRDFDDRDLALLELLRGPLSSFYRLCLLLRNHAGSPEDVTSTAREDDRISISIGRLTRREEEVLGWLRAGKTNREIGEILGISTRTVEKHLEHLLAKAGVENRTAAVLRFSR